MSPTPFVADATGSKPTSNRKRWVLMGVLAVVGAAAVAVAVLAAGGGSDAANTNSATPTDANSSAGAADANTNNATNSGNANNTNNNNNNTNNTNNANSTEVNWFNGCKLTTRGPEVCGSNGVTYLSECFFAHAQAKNASLTRVDKDKYGVCPQSCIKEMMCPAVGVYTCLSDGNAHWGVCNVKIAKCIDPSVTEVSCGPVELGF